MARFVEMGEARKVQLKSFVLITSILERKDVKSLSHSRPPSLSLSPRLFSSYNFSSHNFELQCPGSEIEVILNIILEIRLNSQMIRNSDKMPGS